MFRGDGEGFMPVSHDILMDLLWICVPILPSAASIASSVGNEWKVLPKSGFIVGSGDGLIRDPKGRLPSGDASLGSPPGTLTAGVSSAQPPRQPACLLRRRLLQQGKPSSAATPAIARSLGAATATAPPATLAWARRARGICFPGSCADGVLTNWQRDGQQGTAASRLWRR